MNFTKEQVDELNAIVKVSVGPDDYATNVENALRGYQKRVSLPGFRPGKVPTGMVKKMYGKSILVDEINKLLSDSLYKYIADNQLEVLGNPLPNTSQQQDIDWDNQKEFVFSYDLGLAPQFKVEISGKDKITQYNIKIDDQLINKYAGDIAKRYGNIASADVSEETDMLFGDFVELDASGNILEGGIFKSSSLFLERIKDEETKKKLTGVKRDDKVVLDPQKLNENSVGLAAMLGIEKAVAESINSNFQFTVKNISRLKPAEINQDLFDKVYGPGNVTSEEEFKNKIREELTNVFVEESNNRFFNDCVETLLNKISFSLPDEFLKRWLVAANEKPVSYEQVSEEYDRYAKSLKWQLIENKILKENEIKVTADEAEEHTKEVIRKRMNHPVQDEAFEQGLNETVKKMLSDKEESKKIYDNIYHIKVRDFFRSKFALEEKEVSQDEFYKLIK